MRSRLFAWHVALALVGCSLVGCAVAGGSGPPGSGGDGGKTGPVLGGAGGGVNAAALDSGYDETGVTDVPAPIGSPANTLECSSAHPLATAYFLSPDDSGSMASPMVARELLLKGVRPSPDRIRPWEWMNYFHFDFPEPADRLGIHAELVELDPGKKWELVVAVRAESAPRPKVGLTFVVDGSASMAGPGIARARRTVSSLINALQPDDVVSVVKWSSAAEPIVEGRVLGDAADRAAFADDVVALIAPYGGSDLTGGLQKGYSIAHAHMVTGHNRVVLVSDGGANPSDWDLEQITKELGAADESGIFLTGVGVGPAEGYDDALMDQVTDAARGSYAYVDDDGRTDEILGQHFDELMFVTDDVVGVRLELPGYFLIGGFSGEQISTNADLVRDQHIAPGDTVVLRQELALQPDCPEGIVGSTSYSTGIKAVVTSGKGAATMDLDEVTISAAPDPAAMPSPSLLKARAVYAVANALQTASDAELATELTKALTLLGDAQAAQLAFDDEIDDLVFTLTTFLGTL